MNSGLLPQNKNFFGSDPLAKFLFLHRKMCRRSKHFCRKRMVSFWRGSHAEHEATQTCCQKWMEKVIPLLWRNDGYTGPRFASTLAFGRWQSWTPPDRPFLSMLVWCMWLGIDKKRLDGGSPKEEEIRKRIGGKRKTRERERERYEVQGEREAATGACRKRPSKKIEKKGDRSTREGRGRESGLRPRGSP